MTIRFSLTYLYRKSRESDSWLTGFLLSFDHILHKFMSGTQSSIGHTVFFFLQIYLYLFFKNMPLIQIYFVLKFSIKMQSNKSFDNFTIKSISTIHVKCLCLLHSIQQPATYWCAQKFGACQMDTIGTGIRLKIGCEFCLGL